MHLIAMTLDNSNPRYLEQIFISLKCSRYRGSSVYRGTRSMPNAFVQYENENNVTPSAKNKIMLSYFLSVLEYNILGVQFSLAWIAHRFSSPPEV